MEMRIIDANELIRKFNDGESDTEQERSANQVARYLIRHSPTIDPESLPIVQATKAMCREMVKENRELSKQLDISRRRSGDLSRELEQTKIELDAMRTAGNSLKMHLEKVTQERDAVKQYLRKHYGWCAGCNHFTGVYGQGCKRGKMTDCTEQSDFYEFGEQED